jgi:hypothetical protein
MIPVEYFWGVLILIFGIIGSVRGLSKELGSSALLLLSLSLLYVCWVQFGTSIVSLMPGGGFWSQPAVVQAIYYTASILFVTYIAYQGYVLQFPVGSTGLIGSAFGLVGGLFNGYLVVGTVWDVTALAEYYYPQMMVVSAPLSDLHQTVMQYLPVSLMHDSSPFIMLVLGVILLLAIFLK